MKSPDVFEKKAAFEKLELIGQSHLLSYFDSLKPPQKKRLVSSILNLNLDLYKRQKSCFQGSKQKIPEYALFKEGFSPQSAYREKGKKLVTNGKTALVVMAGGQGSRLRFKGPKGCFPISLIQKKSLFQLIAEKVKYASRQVDRVLPCAWMCSPLNLSETKSYFKKNAFFGLKASQSLFFAQNMWPILDEKGDLFLEKKDQIAMGPNGNGSIFRCLKEAAILEKWEKEGVEIVQVIPVDNPLAAPFDYELFGFHEKMAADVSARASLRKSAQEKVGIFVNYGERPGVLEYSELQPGCGEPALANLGIYSFSLSFIKEAANKIMPQHKAKKAVKKLDTSGRVVFPKEPNGWKFEEFIFDSFQYAKNFKVLLSSREEVFAPLKNLEGEDSIIEVQKELLARDRKVYERVTKSKPRPNFVFELSPEFYYPSESFLKKWEGKEMAGHTYID